MYSNKTTILNRQIIVPASFNLKLEEKMELVKSDLVEYYGPYNKEDILFEMSHETEFGTYFNHCKTKPSVLMGDDETIIIVKGVDSQEKALELAQKELTDHYLDEITEKQYVKIELKIDIINEDSFEYVFSFELDKRKNMEPQ